MKRCRCRAEGTAQALPTAHSSCLVESLRKATAKNAMDMATNRGGNGCNAVRREPHAPPTPSTTRSKGPAQQADAPNAAAVPANKEPVVAQRGRMALPFRTG